MTSPTTVPVTRMNADERRELVLEAAVRAFGRGGYAGTSTDAIAREAGVSQPYVVRIFGTKLELFLEVFDRSTSRIAETFAQTLAERPFDPTNDDDWERLGLTYTELMVSEPSVLRVMMHGFAGSNDAEIGAHARRSMGEIFEVIRSSGCTAERARDFVAQGMLLSVMMAMDAPAHAGESDALAELSVCAFGDMLPSLRQ